MYSIRKGTFENADVDSIEDITWDGGGSAKPSHINEHLNEPSRDTMWLSFVVTTADLTAFQVQYQTHPSGSFFTVASAAADFTSPEGPILGASGDLTIAAAGATVHWLNLNVRGIYAIKLRAAGANTVITGYYSKG